MQKKDYLEIYHQMVLIRRVEERAAELYQQGKIGGFFHSYIGQEAIQTAECFSTSAALSMPRLLLVLILLLLALCMPFATSSL